MTDRTLSHLLRAVALTASLITIAGAGFLAVKGAGGVSELTFSLVIISFGALIWLVAPGQQRNPLFWVLAAFLAGFALWVVGEIVLRTAWPEVELPIPTDPIPVDLPFAVTFIEGVRTGTISAGLFGLLTFGLLLFPDGRLPSPRWRWVGYFCGIGIFALATSLVYDWVSDRETFMGWDIASAGLVWIGPPACLAGLIVRYRRSDQQTRTQIKWIVWGASLFVPLTVLAMYFSDEAALSDFLFSTGLLVLAASYAIGVARYRLFDVDVVISRTLVYGTLAVFIGAVYVGIVVGVGALVGSPDGNTWLGVLATVIIALAFQPLRRWMQRFANRVVYGRRATPYEVLSTFSQRVAGIDPGVLVQIARALVEGTTAEAAGVWMDRGGSLQLMAQWPADHALVSPSDGNEDSFSKTAAVVHDGERLGEVTLSLSPGQPFSPADAQLLDEVAAGLGLALRNFRLTEDLRDRLDQLRDSRRRIVAIQDRTRRKLERDLHDGAQQRLVSLKIRLGLAGTMAAKSGLDDMTEVLESLRAEADETIDSVREFARGIYPPMLEAEGLAPTLTARTRALPIPVTVQAAGIARYPRDMEATVYFCVLEAVRNAVQHSGADSIVVTIEDDAGGLMFEVRDDGDGFDVDHTATGPGFNTLTDRIDAMDGHLDVRSQPGHGTTVRGTIPAKALAPAP